jgi:hypothetical protein
MRHPIDPKIDFVFKALLGAEGNRRLLIHFLNAVLGGDLPAPIIGVEFVLDCAKAIRAAAVARTDSRGAHFRADHPGTGDLPTSRYTLVREKGGALDVSMEPVAFTRVRPGESLLDRAAE